MAKKPTEQELIQKQLEGDIQTPDEASAKAIQSLTDTKHPKTQTEIDKMEVKTLTRIHVLATEFKSDILEDIADNYERLMVSHHRKGRGEIMSIGRAAREEQDAKSKLRRLFTLGRGTV